LLYGSYVPEAEVLRPQQANLSSLSYYCHYWRVENERVSMKRREFVAALFVTTAAGLPPAEAQQLKQGAHGFFG
jgi:hypothetical protein